MRNLSIVKALVGFSLLVLMVSGVLFIIRFTGFHGTSSTRNPKEYRSCTSEGVNLQIHNGCLADATIRGRYRP